MTVGRHYQEKASTADFFVEYLLHMGWFFLLIVYRCLTLLLLLFCSLLAAILGGEATMYYDEYLAIISFTA